MASLPARQTVRVAIVSDIHHAGAAERARERSDLTAATHPMGRALLKAYSDHVWLRHPFDQEPLLHRFLDQNRQADLVVANGDYSCDSGFIGVSDAAARASAGECLRALRTRFGARLQATLGDHELGKKPLGANTGGLRIDSYHHCIHTLGLEPCWRLEVGRYVLIGITSTLVALPLFAGEMLADEVEEWGRLRARHLEDIRESLTAVRPEQRILLFCHDPSALPYLWADGDLRRSLERVERTVLGHLHTPALWRCSQRLAGMPPISFLGHTVRRLSTALRDAKSWRHFQPLFCPSLAGIQLFKDGGYYTADLDLAGIAPAQFVFHPLAWPSETPRNASDQRSPVSRPSGDWKGGY